MQNLILEEKSILIVDDLEENRFLLEYYLKDTKASLLFARNGKEAVDICKSDLNIDLVFMDLQMPVLDGIMATRQIHAFNPQLKVIAVTAYAFPGDRQYCLDAGCIDFISKPIDSEVLIEITRSFLGN